MSFCLSVQQSYRVLSELLQRLHAADRHGVQRVLPPVLWPARTSKVMCLALLTDFLMTASLSFVSSFSAVHRRQRQAVVLVGGELGGGLLHGASSVCVGVPEQELAW